MIASALMTATPGAIANEGASHLLRGEVIFAVNCGRCHINATARFATPAEEMDWLFRPTGPVRAHREIISERDLQSVLDYLEHRESRSR
jgi:mono/diheme cytochrome c family protein